MARWTITSPAAAKIRVINALAALYPIPWTEPEPGSAEVPEPEYTKQQWARIQLRRWLRSVVTRAEERDKVEEAKQQVDTSDLDFKIEEG